MEKNIIILVIITITVATIASAWDASPVVIDKSQIKTVSLIDYPSKFNYRQTINDCGPFNVAAVVRALGKKEINPQQFAEKTEWRLPNKYTLPWGLEKQLKENDIGVENPNLKSLSDKEKIFFLQQRLSQGKPIIILGEKNNFEHYLTIFGFDSSKDEFYVYDSSHDKNPGLDGMTKDDSVDLPGNRIFDSEGLLSFWRNGGIYGIYEWYAVVAGKL
ncbi:MAG: C39 family peptidase [Candidatus Gracilibacteria bacterium]|jgi:hypothetical protein